MSSPSFPPSLILKLLENSLLKPGTSTTERYPIEDAALILTGDLLDSFVKEVIRRAGERAECDDEESDSDGGGKVSY